LNFYKITYYCNNFSDQVYMDLKFLDFEQPIAELEAKIEELRNVQFDNNINISDAL